MYSGPPPQSPFQMEELRARGNALFSSDPRVAAVLYQEALDVYETLDDKSGAVEEYTKCAGNALTCLFKLQEYDACATLAEKVLKLNPLIAKAYAFIGRCLLLRPALTLSHRAGPLPYLCRALHVLPSMCEALCPFLHEALDRLLQERDMPRNREPCVEVRQGECGKCVVAASELPPLLAVSSTLHPFSVCSYEETAGKGLCAHCGVVLLSDDVEELTAPLHVCSQCQLVSYCSDACATSHGHQHEAYECRLFTRLREMLRVMRTCDAEEPADFFAVATHCITTVSGLKVCKEGHAAVLQLEDHAVEASQRLTLLVRLVQDLFSEEDPTFVTRIIGAVRCNALEVCDASGLPVGQALHAANITSYFNHSCAPNCAMEAGAIVTTRTISPGEELTISYLPQLYWPAWLRREELIERYFFDCRCVRCGEGDHNPFEAALVATLRSDSREKEREYVCSVQLLCSRVRAKSVSEVGVADRDALLRLLQDCCQHLFPFHYLCHELRNTLSFVYAVLDDPLACLCSCLTELVLWEAIVPGAHPVKRLKVQNALRCCVDNVGGDDARINETGGSSGSKSDGNDEPMLLLRPLLMKFATLYDVVC
ncbi:hypothetical protein TraAM80_02250 [Trypanosoma rangeli]|uniref:SET domain-containing protein n=1 Tax=Trypanosoma rangeli TaxID=5698 RepID=A0A422NUZ8_TRYRA|nr:uncharacterized protein TraAM80_02250 [Trypanosoma rangeli]RNF09303.1 hypothetical protein TraAM80_02250 [Trypanosoma rangeli]|eukprot:RNF09303.1 hypothetical protein TraAM80_02250 [Trypanosoma rangeli]